VGEGGGEIVARRRDRGPSVLSGAVAAEHSPMEDAPDQTAADATLGYLMELAPQTFAAHQVQGSIASVSRQIRPCHTPNAFSALAARARIDNAIGAAGVGEFD
jgi:hypothetical protein